MVPTTLRFWLTVPGSATLSVEPNVVARCRKKLKVFLPRAAPAVLLFALITTGNLRATAFVHSLGSAFRPVWLVAALRIRPPPKLISQLSSTHPVEVTTSKYFTVTAAPTMNLLGL